MDDSLLTLTEFLLQFRQVRRIIRLPGTEDGWENDAEHSYHLAVLCLYVIDLGNLAHLDRARVLEIALAHDLVETYAGDTYFHSDQEAHRAQKEREAMAMERIAREFPRFPSMNRAIQEYEERSSEEARFVYAMDKLVPVLIIYLDRGRQWIEREVTFSMIADGKRPKVALSPEVVPYFESLLNKLKDQPELLSPDPS